MLLEVRGTIFVIPSDAKAAFKNVAHHRVELLCGTNLYSIRGSFSITTVIKGLDDIRVKESLYRLA